MPPLIPEFKKDADMRLLSCPGEEAALRSAFLIVDVTVLDIPKTDLKAHALGVPACTYCRGRQSDSPGWIRMIGQSESMEGKLGEERAGGRMDSVRESRASVALWDMIESSSMGDVAMPPTPSFSCRSSSLSLPTVLLKSSSSSSGSTYGSTESLPLSPSSVSTIESPRRRFLPLKEDCGSSTTRCTALLLDLAAPPELLCFLAAGARSPTGVFFEPAPSSFPLCDLEAGNASAVSHTHHAWLRHSAHTEQSSVNLA